MHLMPDGSIRDPNDYEPLPHDSEYLHESAVIAAAVITLGPPVDNLPPLTDEDRARMTDEIALDLL